MNPALLPSSIELSEEAFTGIAVYLIVLGVVILASLFLPGISTGQRVITGILGIGMCGYGIYLTLPTTTSMFVSIYILLILPIIVLVANIRTFFAVRKAKNNPVVQGNYSPAAQHPGYQPGQANQGQPVYGQQPQYGQPAQGQYVQPQVPQNNPVQQWNQGQQ